MPNPGKIKIYTSGCPKNQNRCWNKIGSPPPPGSKNVVFRFRSVNSIVIAPARTGSASNKRIVVNRIAQINNGIWFNFMDIRMFIIVVIKLIDPMIDEAPARCSEKIAKSTDGPACARLLDSGG